MNGTRRLGGASLTKLIRRRVIGMRILGLLAPAGGVVLIVAAVFHAANHRERLLALVAIVGCFLAAMAYTAARRDEARAAAASVPVYLAAARQRHRRERQLALLVMATLVFELIFLIPWWIGGVAPHAQHPGSAIVIATGWLPLGVIIALGAWAARLYRRATRGLDGLEAMIREFGRGDRWLGDSVTR